LLLAGHFPSSGGGVRSCPTPLLCRGRLSFPPPTIRDLETSFLYPPPCHTSHERHQTFIPVPFRTSAGLGRGVSPCSPYPLSPGPARMISISRTFVFYEESWGQFCGIYFSFLFPFVLTGCLPGRVVLGAGLLRRRGERSLSLST